MPVVETSMEIKRLPAHPPEPSYPCYLSILGELAEVTPHGESIRILTYVTPADQSTFTVV